MHDTYKHKHKITPMRLTFSPVTLTNLSPVWLTAIALSSLNPGVLFFTDLPLGWLTALSLTALFSLRPIACSPVRLIDLSPVWLTALFSLRLCLPTYVQLTAPVRLTTFLSRLAISSLVRITLATALGLPTRRLSPVGRTLSLLSQSYNNLKECFI